MSGENIDYDKQFQADLERAQALSLETHALEKFRLQKRLQKLSISSTDSTDCSRTPVDTKERDEPTRSDSFKLKSRPRPGTLSTVQPNPIIAPPPSSQRKNTTTILGGKQNDGPDLISFTSPPSNNKLINFHQDIQRINDIPVDNKIIPPTITQNNYAIHQQQIGFHRQLSYGRPMFSALPPQYSFQNGFNVPCIPLQTPDQMYRNQIVPANNIISQDTPQIPTTNFVPVNVTPQITATGFDVLKVLNKQDNSNLIDLATFNYDSNSTSNVKDSVLEAFDPLCTPKPKPTSPPIATSPDGPGDDSMSVCSGSMYEEYDPFEYLYSGSGTASVSEPIYATITRTDSKAHMSPPPLPPRLSQSTLERKRNTRETWINKKTRLYENITITRRRASLVDCDLKQFYQLVTDVRGKFKYNDLSTNSGLVISPMMENQYKDDTSIKLCIHPQLENSDSSESNISPVTFTCNITCSVEHVTLHVACELDVPSTEKYSLKVWGLTEYLAPETTLSDYEYVHNCIKLEQDVVLCLVSDHKVDRSLARTAQDDKRDSFLTLTDLLPNEPVIPISHDSLLILLETLEKEMDRVEKAAADIEARGRTSIIPPLKHSGVVQAVKAVCTLMGSLETPEITEALSYFISTCENYQTQQSYTIQSHGSYEEPDYAEIQRSNSLVEAVSIQCNHIRGAVQALIEMYCQAFRVDFKLGPGDESPSSTIMVSEVADWVSVRICALHRLPLQWKHDNYGIEAQVYHGTRKVGPGFTVPSLVVTSGVNPRILFNNDVILEGVSYCTLGRESRLVLILHGFTMQQPSDNNENSNESQYVKEELGWAAFQFFNYEGIMAQGSMLLSLWPPAANRWIGPAPCPGTHPLSDHPVLGVELMVSHPCVMFPSAPRPTSPEVKGDFSSLDVNTQQQLLEIIEQYTLSNPPVEVREVLWEKRHYLYDLPAALPKVLLAAHSWDWASLGNLHSMLHGWTPMPPEQALQLLLPCFPDMEVRRLAVKWIHDITNDELIDYLPQLVQALKHETYETSSLAEFLLEKSLVSPRVAHHLYWLLTHTLPGQCPQNTTWDSTCADEASVCAARYHRRLQLMLRALLAVSGETLRNCLMSQQLLVKSLYEIAEEVKQTKESLRLKVMCAKLEPVHQSLVDSANCLPLAPSIRVTGVQIRTCSYFPSNTLPLKINFLTPDNQITPAIFKVGDDLQQDMLTIQMVRIMDKLWLRKGLDLKMVSFRCIPTGHKRGMIEMVSSAETLRKIQVEWGLTGSFKDKPIAEWLAKHNPSELEYERARENFTASCAGYSVVTYILGICDRHNDNIMLKTSGHVFHIDFGKFLGDAQMFGNFKRDRTPFVLTSDMAFVINGGDRPSARFHKFVDLCCQAFNIVRANGNLILNLFTFMASSGIPGVTTEAVSYIRNALLPDKSNPEAAALFARLIQSSLKSWFTQFNFFLHNLAQLRFTGDHGDGELLSFVPKTYNMSQEGRLKGVEVIGYEKRYDPDKYYVYILKVERENQPHATSIFRTYKEFCELHQKLCLHFPLAKIHSLPTGIHMGRSNIKQVAEKRYNDIRLFVGTLFHTADEIAHSDLVYTFFHPMLRDQQNMELFTKKSKGKGTREDVGRVRGQLKLTLHYQRGTFSVMVHHARSLPMVAGAQEPSTYVKVYLQPDPSKSTKRKTKVVKRNCHPSFMEMLEYRLSLDIIKSRTLQATVWSHDSLQENEFLGGINLELSQFDLTVEITEWFPLTNVSR